MKHIYNYLSKQDGLANVITGVALVTVFVVQINSLINSYRSIIDDFLVPVQVLVCLTLKGSTEVKLFEFGGRWRLLVSAFWLAICVRTKWGLMFFRVLCFLPQWWKYIIYWRANMKSFLSFEMCQKENQGYINCSYTPLLCVKLFSLKQSSKQYITAAFICVQGGHRGK